MTTTTTNPFPDFAIKHQSERLADARWECDEHFKKLCKTRSQVVDMERRLMALQALVDTERATLEKLIDEAAAWRRGVGNG